MARNAGKDIDTLRQSVRDRDGLSYPVDGMIVAASGLYYGRPLTGGEQFDYHELWALPDQGWVISKLAFFPGAPDACDWYIEPDIISVRDSIWSIRDAYLDVEVHDGIRYHVDDADELADGLRDGAISIDAGCASLTALAGLLNALRRNGCSGAALLKDFAADLPTPR